MAARGRYPASCDGNEHCVTSSDPIEKSHRSAGAARRVTGMCDTSVLTGNAVLVVLTLAIGDVKTYFSDSE